MRPGRTFSSAETRPAGHVFFIPPGERPDDDPKHRPHFLVNRCDPATDPHALGTLAYMSTKATEAIAYGAPSYELRKGGGHVIATRLLPWPAEALVRSGYSATDDVVSVRAAVASALGIGAAMTPVSRSVRGHLARIVEPKTDARFGLVLTRNEYASQRRYQLVVPLYDRVIETPDGPEVLDLLEWDVVPERDRWLDHVPFAEPYFDTAEVMTLTEQWRASRDPRSWLRQLIEVTGMMIDPETLKRVELKICDRLQLKQRAA